MDTDVTRFLHVLGSGVAASGSGIGNLVLKPFFIPEILAIFW